MILVADSGSTKTDWILTDGNASAETVFTSAGLNPNAITDIQFTEIVSAIPEIVAHKGNISMLWFYGAGCGDAINKTRVNTILNSIFQQAAISVNSDIEGAVRAVCGDTPGIVCILGTGSNSCYYDGNTITGQAFSLGYILGDEGSGSYFGKRLLRDYFYGLLPEDLTQKFQEKFAVTRENLLERIYRTPAANEYIASFLPFFKENIHHPYCDYFIRFGFEEFLKIYVWRFEKYHDLPVHFVGSVATHFNPILIEMCSKLNITPGKCISSPVSGIAAYHLRNSQK